jgi:hypothetical protein
MSTADNEDPMFGDALEGLHRGDFSRLAPLFDEQAGRSGEPRILEWHRQGRFRDQPKALAEALTCASFLGRTKVAEYLLTHGVDPSGGAATGLDALHWAANRGQLEAVRLLIRANAPLETRSVYGSTTVGKAIWSAMNEPRGNQLQVIEELLSAGACLQHADYPTGISVSTQSCSVIGPHNLEDLTGLEPVALGWARAVTRPVSTGLSGATNRRVGSNSRKLGTPISAVRNWLSPPVFPFRGSTPSASSQLHRIPTRDACTLPPDHSRPRASCRATVSKTHERESTRPVHVDEAQEVLMLKRFLLAFILVVLCVLVWNLVTNFQPRH